MPCSIARSSTAAIRSLTPTDTAPRTIPFGEALRFWLKLGFISFGGPAGQIAIMHEELVERRRWISERRFLHALNYCMLLPGPEAQQLATYIGWLAHRTWGGIIAGALFVLPSLLILVLLSWMYVSWGNTPLVEGLFHGIKPAVTAVVLHAAWRIGSRALKHAVLWLIAAAAFLAMFLLNAPFPLIVTGAALAGFIGGRLWPAQFRAGGAPVQGNAGAAPSVIDDTTPVPSHARFRPGRFAALIGIGLLLWMLPMAALVGLQGWDGTPAQLAWFFTKAAFLTFGGAYAVLPYVYQGSVDYYGWVSPTQMIDGLALGESTPGPLIMIVAFVGFLAAHAQAIFGPEHLLLAGIAGAVIVTWYTFLPSFLFVLGGGPLVEATRDDIKFVAPLTAITAAVVGVILNLALFFGYHVLWPQGLEGAFDPWSAVLVLAAMVALFTLRRGVTEVILVAGVVGLLLRLAGAT